MTAYLLDTNVVLRLVDRSDPVHVQCRQAVEHLILRGDNPCLAPQVLIEFWVAATRPQGDNGFGWTPDLAQAHVTHLRKLFPLLPDRPEVFDRWLQLVTEHAVLGKQVHDVRLAAFMQVHGVPAVLTLDPRPFRRVGVTVIQPGELGPGAAPSLS